MIGLLFMCVQSVFANSYVGVMKGLIKGVVVKYDSDTSVKITTGYGECNGHYFEITGEITHTLTSLGIGEDFHYIYIDDANSEYPDVSIIDSIDEPSWSDERQGWYYGDDRCIGVVWSPDGSSTIMNFQNNLHQKYVIVNNYLKQVLNNGTPDGTWKFLETTDYIPVNAIAVFVHAMNTAPSGKVQVNVARYENISYEILAQSSWLTASQCRGWIELERGDSRDLKWHGDSGDSSNFDVYIYGYQIER